jgi:hypothetical protein
MNCTLWCASYLLGIAPSKLITEIGHSGEEILWPEYTDSRKYRGYSIAEVQDCFWMRHQLLAPIFLFPRIAPGFDAKSIQLWSHERAGKRLNYMTAGRRAIVLGQVGDIGHAVVWDQDHYVDVRGLAPKTEIADFSPQEVYIVCTC